MNYLEYLVNVILIIGLALIINPSKFFELVTISLLGLILYEIIE